MAIQIAAGIVLGVIMLALLPAIVAGALWTVAIGIGLAAVLVVIWLLWEGARTAEGFAIELIVAGVFLVWLAYEVKARREMADEVRRAVRKDLP
jgi:hypothetical protein